MKELITEHFKNMPDPTDEKTPTRPPPIPTRSQLVMKEEELEHRERNLKEAAVTIALSIGTLEAMVKELRAHAINAKWTPLFGFVQILLLSCILVALLSR